ncbi:hypothetical protein H4R20_000126 [Coemansia guatemalensis]|uniref:Uncharacterized protein n=1 Tax=Coemansia guatemalensis TaxID=2761395 RepID=A0A9W8I4F9_9FUNG|nr:hypothetical protein H4R20_000126 [Coemansia guatemalensis]
MTKIEGNRLPSSSIVDNKQVNTETKGIQTLESTASHSSPVESKSAFVFTSPSKPAPAERKAPLVLSSTGRRIAATRSRSAARSIRAPVSDASNQDSMDAPEPLSSNGTACCNKKTARVLRARSKVLPTPAAKPAVETEGTLKVGEGLAPELVSKAEQQPEEKTASVSEAKEESAPQVEAKLAQAKTSVPEAVPAPVAKPIPAKEESVSESETQDEEEEATIEQNPTPAATPLTDDAPTKDSIQGDLQPSSGVVGAEAGAALEALEAKCTQLHSRRETVKLEALAEQEKAEEEFNAVLKQAREKKYAVMAKNVKRMSAIDEEILANGKEIDAAIAEADQILRRSVHPRILMLLEARAASVGNNIASEQAGE